MSTAVTPLERFDNEHGRKRVRKGTQAAGNVRILDL